MANASGLISSPPCPAASLANMCANFLATSSITPTLAAPTFRAGSTNTFTSASAPTTISVPLSASIVVGDMILLCAKGVTGSFGNNPPGFGLLVATTDVNGYSLTVWWKIAQAGDPGSNISWTHGFGAVQFTATTMSYSGVNAVVPGYWGSNLVTTGTTVNAPTITTPVASTVLEVFTAYNSGGAVTLTAPATQRVTANISNIAIAVSEQVQGAAGSTGTQTCTASATSAWGAVTLILFGAASGGAVAPGGWNVVDIYNTSTGGYQTQFVVYQSPGASNNLSSTWYLVMQYQNNVTGPAAAFAFFACETYTPAAHTYNAAIISTNSTPPYTPSSSASTPPYAQIAGAANIVNSAYNSMVAPNFAALSLSTNNFLIAANRDGFFLSVLAGGSLSRVIYIGGGTTLITNPSLTSYELPLMYLDLYQTVGACSREPGWTSAGACWGYYNLMPFWPAGQQGSTDMGIIPTANGDLFLAAGAPIAARILLSRGSANTNIAAFGNLRAIGPAWLQYAYSSGCAWGDTVTEGSDTLTLAGTTPAGNSWIWVDTSTA